MRWESPRAGVVMALAGSLVVGTVGILPFSLAYRMLRDAIRPGPATSPSTGVPADLLTQAMTVVVMVTVTLALWWAVVWWVTRSTRCPTAPTWTLAMVGLLVPAVIAYPSVG